MRRAEAFFRARPALIALAVFTLTGVALLSSSLLSGRVLASEDVLLYQSPFAPALTPQTPPSNQFLFDAFYQLHPDQIMVRRTLRSGHLPTWSPYQGGGEPIIASQQHAMFTPLNWLLTVGPYWQSLEWVALFKLVAAAFGLYLLLVALGLRRSAAIFGGVAFMGSAPLTDWLSHPHVNVYVLLPWLMLAGERLVQSRTWRDALWVAVALALVVLGGHPPSMVIVGSVALPWFVYRALARDGLSRETVRTSVKYGAGLLLGLCIGAFVLWPLVELSQQSYQVSRSSGGGPKSILFGFFAPDLWGRPDKFEIAGGPLNYLERTGYFGVLPLVLAVAGFARRPRGPQVFLALAALISLSLVVQLPVLTRTFDGLPGVDQVNRFRYLVVCAFCGAALGAYGLDALLSAATRRARLTALAVSALAAALPLAWVAKHRDVLGTWRTAWKHVVGIGHEALNRPELQLAVFMRWALFAAIGLLVVAVALWRPRWAAGAAAVLIAIAAFDVVSYERGFQPSIPLAQADPPTPEAIKLLQAIAGHQRVAGNIELGPNVAERYALRDARVYRSPPLERRGRLWSTFGGAGIDYEQLPPAAGRLTNLYGVENQISYELEASKKSGWRPAGVSPVVRNADASPRAWVAYSWTPARDLDDALAKMQAANEASDVASPVIERAGAPRRAAGAGAPRRAAAGAGVADATGAVRFVRDDETRVTLEVDAARAGQLILADTYYPGWQATVDGKDADIRPANASFRAVAVPVGRHSVDFRYRPTSVRAGALVSALALLALAAGFVLTRRRA